MATIFAGDESGNLGFAFEEGGTRYFVVALFGLKILMLRVKLSKSSRQNGN
jgi:hypothetical protein